MFCFFLSLLTLVPYLNLLVNTVEGFCEQLFSREHTKDLLSLYGEKYCKYTLSCTFVWNFLYIIYKSI